MSVDEIKEYAFRNFVLIVATTGYTVVRMIDREGPEVYRGDDLLAALQWINMLFN